MSHGQAPPAACSGYRTGKFEVVLTVPTVRNGTGFSGSDRRGSPRGEGRAGFSLRSKKMLRRDGAYNHF
jgi:hypothetical protein